MGFVPKRPTGFLEELCQDVIIRFLLRLAVFPFPKGSSLHQVGDAVAFTPRVLGVLTLLMFELVRVNGVAVLPLFPVFLWADQRRLFVSDLLRAGGVFHRRLNSVPVSVILSCARCILVGALAVCFVVVC